MFYPLYNSIDFSKSLVNKLEFKKAKYFGNLKDYQILLRNFISPLSPYNSILLYHKTGTGKTLTSLNIAINFLKSNKRVVVVTKNKTLKNNFIIQAKEFFGIDGFKNAGFSRIEYYSYSYFLKKKNKTMDNSLVIIDEIHNMINNNLYTQLLEVKKINANMKLVLLSATPSFDNIKEIFEIANALSDPSDIGYSNYSDLLKNKLIKEPQRYKSNPNFFLKNNVYFLTEKGKEYLRKKMKGKVSYVDIDLANPNFPQQSLQGTSFMSDKLTMCKMSPDQEKLYDVALKDTKDTLFKAPSYISILGIADFEKSFNLIDKQNNLYYPKGDFLLKSKIANYSGKLAKLLENVLDEVKKPGTIYIYSNYVSSSGVNVIKAMLLANGFNFYTKNQRKGYSFAHFENSFTQTKKDNILKMFNSKENTNGDLIKVFIASPMSSEGVNFKNIRYLHIMDPHWNYSRLDQIIGRSIRYNSLEYFQKASRVVKIYKYASVSKKNYSIDLYKYELSIEKDRAIKEVEYLLKTLAIDCNINKVKHNAKYDKTRICSYKLCNYTCEITKGHGHSSSKRVDTSTYNVYFHSKEEYNYIKDSIFLLMNKYSILVLENFIEALKDKVSVIDNVYLVLDDLITGKTTFSQNSDYTLNYYNKYYILEKN